MSVATIIKDPDAVLPYTLNWASPDGTNDGTSADTGWLQGNTIASSSWTVEGPDALLVIDSDSNTTKAATVVLSGGTVNRCYRLINHITLSTGGYEDDRTIEVRVAQR